VGYDGLGTLLSAFILDNNMTNYGEGNVEVASSGGDGIMAEGTMAAAVPLVRSFRA
jgi:hypothetical protein